MDLDALYREHAPAITASLVTIPKADPIERAGALSAAKLRQLDDALRFALGLDPRPSSHFVFLEVAR